ncbi:SAM-dependent methyltransferase [Halobiforma lacisalsi AJ5]|uniref:SAM-dependent methyltransferase n=1 Tax=Natronobacterium lacisalsi AJ5 TaxID=358396 RepID=M0LFV6_NATLA|nr:class I SAM-dependent methyltransferase [Halobiforma lacisalsi]APW98606.1 SAM-dependent methyltransferase [Halobiforma lacisalsi AJ5]EMA32467.1 SAM-dependent methyltransferase, UbiE/COQ5 family protein [Halobiforma lacisalsi AJ5]
MPTTAPFEEHAERYEGWFEEHGDAYRSELEALERLVPSTGRGLEIGVGSARFAAPLGIEVGIDPAEAMLERARERDVDAVRGVAESLPFRDGSFDTALIVTAICFVDDIPATLAEADRVLRPSGSLVIGYIDRESPVGRKYQEMKEHNPFYRDATFVSTDELVDRLEATGFTDFEYVQTIYHWLDEIDGPEPVEEGYGEGSFVGIRATR